MKRLIDTTDPRGIKEAAAAGASSLTELSAADIDRVSGAGCWMTATSPTGGIGYYHHSGYPVET